LPPRTERQAKGCRGQRGGFEEIASSNLVLHRWSLFCNWTLQVAGVVTKNLNLMLMVFYFPAAYSW
jgi:hypothetical protein